MRTLPFDHAFRNALRRPVRSLLLVLACSLVCGLLAATSAFVSSLEESHRQSAPAATALLISTAATGDILRSAISPAVSELVAADVPSVRTVGGVKASSPEIHMGTDLRVEGHTGVRTAVVRGVTERALLVHEAVTLTEGRWPRPGEALVGGLAAARSDLPDEALALGARLEIEGGSFVVSGRFEAPRTTLEGEIWVPLIELQGLTEREDVSCVFVGLESESALSDVELFALRRLDLELVSHSARAYYAGMARYFRPILGLAWAMALLVGAAAMAGGANTILAAVQERSREMGTLRALGFGGGSLALLLLQEILLLGMVGGLVGLLVTRLLVTEVAITLSMSAFELRLDAQSLLIGLGGLLGVLILGAVPALWRILRQPVVQALRGS